MQMQQRPGSGTGGEREDMSRTRQAQGGPAAGRRTEEMRAPTVVARPPSPPLLSASSRSGRAMEAEADCSTARSRSAGASTRSLRKAEAISKGGAVVVV